MRKLEKVNVVLVALPARSDSLVFVERVEDCIQEKQIIEMCFKNLAIACNKVAKVRSKHQRPKETGLSKRGILSWTLAVLERTERVEGGALKRLHLSLRRPESDETLPAVLKHALRRCHPRLQRQLLLLGIKIWLRFGLRLPLFCRRHTICLRDLRSTHI